MTEFELLEAISFTGDKIGGGAMGFVSVVFAYVIAAHFAGKNLSRNVAVFTSIVYTLFLSAPILSATRAILRMAELSARYVNEYPESTLASEVPVEIVLSASLFPLFVGWLGSLLYMHGSVRRAEVRH